LAVVIALAAIVAVSYSLSRWILRERVAAGKT